MNGSELIQAYRDLFRCRENAYAEGFPRGDGKYGYRKVTGPSNDDLPLTDEAIRAHLKGDRIIGVYPLLANDHVWWVAFDFDGGDDPVEDAVRQRDVLLKAGFFSFVERSRSGNGAHLWVFFDSAVPASKVRRVMRSLLINADSFDRMFPNQDSAANGYGNLIALPYHGESFREGRNSCFLDREGEPVHPAIFLEKVKKNKTSLLDKALEGLPTEVSRGSTGTRTLPVMQYSGALKVCQFCNWTKMARDRMPLQNQEPELYALACQFVHLKGGKTLLDDYGGLHPYDQRRIDEKWNRAAEQNKPDTCQTLRDKFGDCGKRCDVEMNIRHPYELAKVPFNKLRGTEDPTPELHDDVVVRVVDKAKRVANNEEELGIAFGWDPVDDLTELRNGDLIIMAALPSIGKTAGLIDIAYNVASTRGIPSYIASIEMNRERLATRMLARRTEIDSTRIEKGDLTSEEWALLKAAQTSKLPIYYEDTVQTLEQILDAFGELVHKHGKGVGFVDYLQLIAPEENEREREATARAVVGLKSIAKFLDIPIVALSQLGRMAEKDERDGEDPLDSWLASSAMIERTADVIFYLRGKKTHGSLARRKLRIHKERNRGVAGLDIDMDLRQDIYKFIPRGAGRLAYTAGDEDLF